jgi:hypothetical protein
VGGGAGPAGGGDPPLSREVRGQAEHGTFAGRGAVREPLVQRIKQLAPIGRLQWQHRALEPPKYRAQ